MKERILSIVLLFFAALSIAQVPQGFSFQGVAFDDNGDPLNETEISVRIEILDGDVSGAAIYAEVHDIITSVQGLYSLSVGMGDVESGQFEDIAWLEDLKFIKVSIDYSADGEYEVVGTNQFMSVPYALAAGSAPVEQQIYVKLPPNKNNIIAKNGIDYDGQGSIRFIYQWIDGTPEDVFIEIAGLPDNIAIYTNGRGGFGLSEVVKNTSNVDSIIDGIFKPSSFIGLDNPSEIVPPGIYPLELTFKTEGKVFESLVDTLRIYGIAYEDCFSVLPSTYFLESVSCDSLAELFQSEIIIDSLTLTTVSISEIFIDENETSSVSFFQDQPCDTYLPTIGFPWSIDNKLIDLISFEFIDNKFRFEFRFDDFSTGEVTDCLVIYGE